MEKLALTVAEAAALGGPCRSVLYRDIKKGRLRAIKAGRSTCIFLADYKAYLASFPPFREKVDGLAPERSKDAGNGEHPHAQASFDFKQSQKSGPVRVDRSSGRGV